MLIAQPAATMKLYDDRKQRLYINAAERERFITAAQATNTPVQTLALTMVYTGCRISEALELSPASIQAELCLISIRSLKKRAGKVEIREVPIPPDLANRLARICHEEEYRKNSVAQPRLWPMARSTAWRHIKDLMALADISGVHASPKGLRHGYGIHAIRCGVPLNMLRKWMGHASISTTELYANAMGREEQEIAARMW